MLPISSVSRPRAQELSGKYLPVHNPIFADSRFAGCSCGRPDCPSPGKHPRLFDWQLKATVRYNQIVAWRQMFGPDVNFGITPAPWVHIFDVDDPAAAKAFPFPETFTVATGRPGGHQLWYTVPPGVILGSPRLAPGIDTRGQGAQVLAAGSLHYSGRRYEIIDDRPMAPMPTRILELLRTRSTDKKEKEEAAAGIPGASLQVEHLQVHSATKKLILEGVQEPGRFVALASVYKSLALADYSEAQIADICWNPAHRISEKPRLEWGRRGLERDIRRVLSRKTEGFSFADLAAIDANLM